MDEELFQNVCTEINRVLESYFPGELRERAAAVGMVHAAMLYAILRMHHVDEDELMKDAISYLEDLFALMKARPDLTKFRLSGVH